MINQQVWLVRWRDTKIASRDGVTTKTTKTKKDRKNIVDRNQDCTHRFLYMSKAERINTKKTNNKNILRINNNNNILGGITNKQPSRKLLCIADKYKQTMQQQFGFKLLLCATNSIVRGPGHVFLCTKSKLKSTRKIK